MSYVKAGVEPGNVFLSNRHCHHYHPHIAIMVLSRLLTHFGATHPEVLSLVLPGFCCLLLCSSFINLGNLLQDIMFTYCRVSPVIELLTLASGQACFGMAFPPSLMKQLYYCDSVAITSSVGTEFITRRCG
jgi:hypothetical protein